MTHHYTKPLLLLVAIGTGVAHANTPTISLSPVAATMLCSAAGDAAARKTEFWANGYTGAPNTQGALEQLYRDAAQHPTLSFTPEQRYTDDTAMAYQTLMGLHYRFLTTDNNLMGRIAKFYIHDMADMNDGWAAPGRAPGIACKQAVSTLKSRTQTHNTTWWRINHIDNTNHNAIHLLDETKQGNGSGSVMRSHAFGIAYWTQPTGAAELAALHSEITHWHPRAIASCAAFAGAVAHSITDAQDNRTGDFGIMVAHMMTYASQHQGPHCPVDQVIREAYKKGCVLKSALAKAHITSGTQLINATTAQEKELRTQYMHVLSNGSDGYHGWTADTALAAAVFIVTLFPNDIESALYAAVYTPGDSDTIATLVGALVGPRCHTAIPTIYNNIENAEILIKSAEATAEMITQVLKPW